MIYRLCIIPFFLDFISDRSDVHYDTVITLHFSSEFKGSPQFDYVHASTHIELNCKCTLNIQEKYFTRDVKD